MTDTDAPRPRGRKPSCTALSSAERQRRYRERQKAKLAAAASAIPLRNDKAEDRIAELNRENDGLAVEVDRLQRAVHARDNEIARVKKRVDELVADLAFLRSRVATWKAEDCAVSADAPITVTGKRRGHDASADRGRAESESSNRGG
jgi:chromosome segregation ATPase